LEGQNELDSWTVPDDGLPAMDSTTF
jgi:hypothetical protein